MTLCTFKEKVPHVEKHKKIVSQVWLAAFRYLFQPFVSSYAIQFRDLVDLVDIVAVLDQ